MMSYWLCEYRFIVNQLQNLVFKIQGDSKFPVHTQAIDVASEIYVLQVLHIPLSTIFSLTAGYRNSLSSCAWHRH